MGTMIFSGNPWKVKYAPTYLVEHRFHCPEVGVTSNCSNLQSDYVQDKSHMTIVHSRAKFFYSADEHPSQQACILKSTLWIPFIYHNHGNYEIGH